MKKVLLTAVVVFMFFGNNVFAEEFKEKIEIASEDQICEKDADCTVIETSCVRLACDWPGDAVNKKFLDKYDELLQGCRNQFIASGNKLTSCDMYSPPTEPKCYSNHCEMHEIIN